MDSPNILEEYRLQLRNAAEAAKLRLSGLESQSDALNSNVTQAEEERALLRNKLAALGTASGSGLQEGYQKLLISSNDRSLRLQAEMERLRPLLLEARKEWDQARASLETASREIERQSKSMVEADSRFSKAAAQLGALQRYPESYPGIEKAGAFFMESLLNPAGPISPFQGVTCPEQLEPDTYALRYQALMDGMPCTLRIVQTTSDSIDDLASAWHIESENAEMLARASTTIFFPAVLRKALSDAPGFVILQRPSVKTLTELIAADTQFPLSRIAVLATAFHQCLDARARSHMISTIPRPETIGITGLNLTLLEPTSIAVGALSPSELSNSPVAALRRMTRSEYEQCWVYGIAALIAWMLPGEARRAAQNIVPNSILSSRMFLGPIQSAARRSNQAHSMDDCALLAELLSRALQAPAQNRPPLLDLAKLLTRLAGVPQDGLA